MCALQACLIHPLIHTCKHRFCELEKAVFHIFIFLWASKQGMAPVGGKEPACLPCKGAACMLMLDLHLLPAVNIFTGRRHVMQLGLPRLLVLVGASSGCVRLAVLLLMKGMQNCTNCSCAVPWCVAAHSVCMRVICKSCMLCSQST